MEMVTLRIMVMGLRCVDQRRIVDEGKGGVSECRTMSHYSNSGDVDRKGPSYSMYQSGYKR